MLVFFSCADAGVVLECVWVSYVNECAEAWWSQWDLWECLGNSFDHCMCIFTLWVCACGCAHVRVCPRCQQWLYCPDRTGNIMVICNYGWIGHERHYWQEVKHQRARVRVECNETDEWETAVEIRDENSLLEKLNHETGLCLCCYLGKCKPMS